MENARDNIICHDDEELSPSFVDLPADSSSGIGGRYDRPGSFSCIHYAFKKDERFTLFSFSEPRWDAGAAHFPQHTMVFIYFSTQPAPDHTTVFSMGTNHYGVWDIASGEYNRTGRLAWAGDITDHALLECTEVRGRSPFSETDELENENGVGWVDGEGRSCAVYAAREYCFPDEEQQEQGVGWDADEMGEFKTTAVNGAGVQANFGCCQCGGGLWKPNQDAELPTDKIDPAAATGGAYSAAGGAYSAAGGDHIGPLVGGSRREDARGAIASLSSLMLLEIAALLTGAVVVVAVVNLGRRAQQRKQRGQQAAVSTVYAVVASGDSL
jgi:hypothetical protein